MRCTAHERIGGEASWYVPMTPATFSASHSITREFASLRRLGMPPLSGRSCFRTPPSCFFSFSGLFFPQNRCWHCSISAQCPTREFHRAGLSFWFDAQQPLASPDSFTLEGDKMWVSIHGG